MDRLRPGKRDGCSHDKDDIAAEDPPLQRAPERMRRCLVQPTERQNGAMHPITSFFLRTHYASPRARSSSKGYGHGCHWSKRPLASEEYWLARCRSCICKLQVQPSLPRGVFEPFGFASR